MEGFARAARVWLDTVIQDPLAAPAMDDAQAAKFEATVIQYGEYQGQPYGKVPISRLDWYVDSGKDLRAYLRSDRAQVRRNAEPS